MSEQEAPNPERRSDNAVLLMSVGIGMAVLAWVLGAGGVFTAMLAGDRPEAVAGGLIAFLCLPILAIGGALLALIAVIWIIVRVIVDSREAHAKERYSDVER
jgi:hypothetical protein